MSQTLEIAGFQSLAIKPDLLNRLERQGISTPTPIQSQAIPIALKGTDVIGIAQTGTGKTLAFALPMITRLERGQVGLVLAPTRELAQQIAETLNKLGEQAVLIVGGESMYNQIQGLRRRPSFIVATPGRLIDHMERRTVRISDVQSVVLDEADRMLDMGFAPAIKRILDSTINNRQTMLFSATMPKEIEDLANNYLVNPERVEIAPQGTVTDLVEQQMLYLQHEEKRPSIDQFVDGIEGPILIFSRTKHGARKLAKSLNNDGIRTGEIHASRTLPQRREALAGFKSGKYRVLVATDIAARGIDVKDISLVINYDLPECAEDYIHRIGRTGRAGSKGLAVSFALSQQVGLVRAIEKLMKMEIEISPLSTAIPKSQRGGTRTENQKNPFRDQRFKKTSEPRAPRSQPQERQFSEPEVPQEFRSERPSRNDFNRSERSSAPRRDYDNREYPTSRSNSDRPQRDNREARSYSDQPRYGQRDSYSNDRPTNRDYNGGNRSERPMSRDYNGGNRSDRPMSRDYNGGNRSDRPMERGYNDRPQRSEYGDGGRPPRRDSNSGYGSDRSSNRGRFDDNRSGRPPQRSYGENSRRAPYRGGESAPKADGWFERKFSDTRGGSRSSEGPRNDRPRNDQPRSEGGLSFPKPPVPKQRRNKGDVPGSAPVVSEDRKSHRGWSGKPKKARHKRK